ncbi:GntR family transcriptional regulator [Brachybacterium squillarum]|uniref:GntR family transcriptional regulator n=1 Tax=Brachybacterium squillarum TaxID=661979 RepID=UPI00026298B7|nr:GntR family transcriptional regulator [Brachybacterium squillarum]
MSGLRLDAADPAPPYEQIRRGIRRQISEGVLEAGDRLPAIRALAEELGLAPGTVARTYKELEEEGWVTTRRGAGTRVSPEGVRAARTVEGPPGSATPVATELRELLAGPVREARSQGYRDDEIAAALRQVLRGTDPA